MLLSVYCLSVAAEDVSPATEKIRLVYGVPHFPPGSIVNDKGFSGTDVDLMTYLAKKSNVDMTFSACSWIRCLELAKAGKVDLLASVSYTEERTAFLHYVHPSYKAGQINFIVRKGEAAQLAQFEDLRGKVIGKEKGAMLDDRIDKNPDLTLYEAPDPDTLFTMLVSGRIDTLMGFDSVAVYLAQNSKFSDLLEIAHLKISVPSGYLAVSKHTPEATLVVKRFEAQLRRLLTSGKLLDYSR